MLSLGDAPAGARRLLTGGRHRRSLWLRSCSAAAALTGCTGEGHFFCFHPIFVRVCVCMLTLRTRHAPLHLPHDTTVAGESQPQSNYIPSHVTTALSLSPTFTSRGSADDTTVVT